jgi:hypothetical protein
MPKNDFGWALAQMRAGMKVRRRGWRDIEYISIHPKLGIVDEDSTRTVFRDSDPLLAMDWEIANG